LYTSPARIKTPHDLTCFVATTLLASGKHIGFGRLKKHIAKLRMKTQRYASWTLLDSDGKRYGKVKMGKRVYKFVPHRQMNGTIKTATVKRGKIVPARQRCAAGGSHCKLKRTQARYPGGHR
jgi:hypothetical protein